MQTLLTGGRGLNRIRFKNIGKSYLKPMKLSLHCTKFEINVVKLEWLYIYGNIYIRPLICLIHITHKIPLAATLPFVYRFIICGNG